MAITDTTDLNKYLQQSGAPVAGTMLSVNRMQFNAEFLRNIVTNAKIQSLNISKVNAGTITVAFNVGSTVGGAYIQLDGANNRILVNDGTVNRIVIGSV